MGQISNFYDKIPHRPYGCWEWTGCKSSDGYGKMSFKGKPWLAHRFSWQHVNGDIPDGMYVCHKCDNPSCVNPKHLFLGTQFDNMSDMKAKGRDNLQDGASNPNAKLTEEDVLKIRADSRILKEIAADYGVKFAAIGHIKRRRTWKHV